MAIPNSLKCPYKESPTGLEIKRFRGSHGWTQDDVSQMLGVGIGVVSLWESGQTKLRTAMWELLKIKGRVYTMHLKKLEGRK